MQRAAAAIGRRGGDLARLAVELGYFDQAHLANDLRALVGVTPAALAAERPIAMSHLFGHTSRPSPPELAENAHTRASFHFSNRRGAAQPRVAP